MLKWIDIPPVWLLGFAALAWIQATHYPMGLDFGGAWADFAAAAASAPAPSPSQNDPVAPVTHAHTKAPTMYSEPCARLISPITPNTSVSPAAIRNSITPNCTPLSSCSITSVAGISTGVGPTYLVESERKNCADGAATTPFAGRGRIGLPRVAP